MELTSKKLTNKEAYRPVRETKANQKANPSFDFQELEKVVEFMKKHGLSELEWDDGQTRVSLKTDALREPRVSAVSARDLRDLSPDMSRESLSEGAFSKTESAVAQEKSNRFKKVLSPFVGTFYRSAAPGEKPYVSSGEKVSSSDTVCIVEAMKLMNEVETEFSGKIVSIYVEDGQPVQYGEPLFLIEVN
jgi:acetyl-CoA carboxylase biotin carboxyl carrier protein